MARNSFLGEGNIGKMELRKVAVGDEHKPVLNLSVRFNVDRKQADGSWQDSGGFWTDVEYWGKRAEIANALLQVGARVVVGGELSDASFPSSEDPNVLIPALKVRAEFIALSPIGIETVVFKPKKNRSENHSAQAAAEQAGANNAGPASSTRSADGQERSGPGADAE